MPTTKKYDLKYSKILNEKLNSVDKIYGYFKKKLNLSRRDPISKKVYEILREYKKRKKRNIDENHSKHELYDILRSFLKHHLSRK